MTWRLTLEAAHGPDAGSIFEYEVAEPIVFGRNGTPDLWGRRPTDGRISREHLQLQPEEAGVRARASSPRLRFLVDDRPQSDSLLTGGEWLGLGTSTFRVRLERTSERAAAPPAPADSEKPPDTTNIEIRGLDEIELLHEVGRGSMGRVYMARDRQGRRLCVKLMHSDLEGPAAALRRFFAREIDLVGGVRHPNVVRTLYAGRGEEDLFLAMEWVDGTSLHDEVTHGGPLSVLDVCAIGRQLLSALACVHAAGIVHRDVKPDNVMLRGARGAWFPVLIDFGLARIAGELGRGITETGEARGTLGYAPLECLRDAKRAGPTADVFGVGASLYFALTAATYFPERESQAALLEVIGGQELIPIRDRRADVPAELAAVLEQSLALRPQDRQVSAREMVEQLVRAEGAVRRREADRP